jgi:hypothetical protein
VLHAVGRLELEAVALVLADQGAGDAARRSAIRPRLMSASRSPDDLVAPLVIRILVGQSPPAPNTTWLPALSLLTSMISRWRAALSSCLMRPSMKPCCSRAAWYSAFSFRSPWRARLGDGRMTSGDLRLQQVQLRAQALRALHGHGALRSCKLLVQFLQASTSACRGYPANAPAPAPATVVE